MNDVLRLPTKTSELHVLHSTSAARQEYQKQYQAVILGGSPTSVHCRDPWLTTLQDAIREWVIQEMPLLGICFGHELIAKALGGAVEKNSSHTILGAEEVLLTREGMHHPLCSACPTEIPLASSHSEFVSTLPKNAVVLATSPLCPTSVLEYGPTCFGIQQHPEMPAWLLRDLMRARVPEEQRDVIEKQIQSVQYHYGQQLLQNFLKIAIPK